MQEPSFTEGVKPGGLTTATEIRILLCYILDNASGPVSREQLEEVLLGEELANYFVLVESLSHLENQGLIQKEESGYRLTESGHAVARTLAHEVPRTVRETAVRGVIRAQQYAAKKARHKSEITKEDSGLAVRCAIEDETGPFFRMELYMPDHLTAESVRDTFIEKGDSVYKLMLAALTGNEELIQRALEEIGMIL